MADDRRHIHGLLHAGRLDDARVACEAWCAGSDDPDAWFLLAGIHVRLGNLEGVAACCREVIRHRPGDAAAHYNLGVALQSLGHATEAAQSYRAALDFDPGHAAAHANLALVLRDLGRPREALPHAEAALRLSPSLAQAHNTLGLARLDLGEPEMAVGDFRQALRLRPDYVEAHYNLGLCHERRRRWDEALQCFRNALRLKPEHVPSHNDMGNVLRAMGKTEEALASYRRAVELSPDGVEGLNNLGVALLELNRIEEAVTTFERVLTVQPDNALAHNNLANVRVLQDRIAEARAGFERALAIEPEYVEAHWNYALALLLDGDFERGWREYEWRWRRDSVLPRPFSWPRWDGSPLTGGTLLVYAEQGIGDEIMFASCLPDVLARAGRVVIDCDPRLAPLFKRSFPGATVYGSTQGREPAWPQEAPPIDAQIPVGSLPLYLRTSMEAFPRHRGYLVPDAGCVNKWRERYAGLGEGLRIGISWRGGGLPAVKARRSTALDRWWEIFRTPNSHFVNLQYGNASADIGQARSLGVVIHDWDDSDPLQDLDDFAAKIAALDLVISVDNSTVHLAGALGGPVWVLQPFAPDWRWLRRREDSPWYPSVRQFRAAGEGRWEEVFALVARSLSSPETREALRSRRR